MHRCSRSFFAGLAALLALCLFIVPASAVFDVAYCSSQNTADNFSAKHWDWQSNGWCTDECKKEGKYAFAVILEKDCWCSDYIPEDQQDTGDCNSNCPGFPTEKCGNTDDNLYIYLKLDSEPSGTAGGSKPTSVKSPTSTPTTLQTTTSDELAPPQTSVRVITESGAIITQTVVTTPTAAPVQQTRKSSSNTGAIVGGVVGGLIGVIALVGSIFFILWRHRKQQKEAEDPQTGVQRNTSTMSKSGLLRTEKEPQFLPPIMTNFNGRQSRNLDQDSISPISGSDQRNSRHMVDQRLNPSTIFVFENNSTGSLGSVDDSRDYHRPLNVRNPDPEA